MNNEDIVESLEIEPELAVAQKNLGNALQQQGQLEEAITCYQQAIKIKPDYVDAYYNLGNALQQQGQLEKAITCYQQAIKIKPDHVNAHSNLGNALQQQGKLEQAIQSYQKALEIQPGLPLVYNNLGTVFQQQHKWKTAIKSYQKALEINPDFAEAHDNLGNAFLEAGEVDQAVQSYQKALALKPDLAQAKLGICISQLPIIYSSFEEIQLRRNNYQQQLENLVSYYQLANTQDRANAAEDVGTLLPFFLAYQGLNDRDLQRSYGEMICQIMASRYTQNCQPIPIPNLANNEKIRIGLVSGYFQHHSNWRIPIRGWIENLDITEFELFGYYTNAKRDRETVKAAKAFDKFIQGPLPIEQWCHLIEQDNLHVLIFPELGMDTTTVKLGCLRLAPIQITSWGHPNTSGLPTIDYYLSSDLMEPKNAQEHYTEKLVRLPNLSIYYSPLEIQPERIEKQAIGLKDNEIMFWCCQSLFKYLPQDDDVFPRIAQEVGNCKFVFIKFVKGEWVTEVFRQRLSHAFEEFGFHYQDYCIFLSSLEPQKFAGVTAIADIFLDSIGWSGCNSTLETIPYNIPIVALPGELMRGRHTTAILQMMGIAEMIAASKEDYVKIAVRLAQDAEYRRHISQQIADNKHKLYNDLEPIKALEDFLLNIFQKQRRTNIPTVADALRLAMQHHQSHRLDQAQQYYHQILAQQPEHPEALYGLGMLAQQKGELQEAEKFLSTASKVQPDSVKIWFTLGNLRQLDGQLPAAEDAYKKAIALRPDAAPIYNNLGYTLEQQGKLEEAINCYKKTLELQPNCIEADVNLGNALHTQGKLSKNKQAHYAELNHKLGLNSKNNGDLQTAEIYFQKALELNPNYGEV